ncbi:MAG: hypothetical protein JNM98_06910 [Rhodocyclaceae bacterium]|nr:hypothetical protein [Rhodocyclaceae bacterium]
MWSDPGATKHPAAKLTTAAPHTWQTLAQTAKREKIAVTLQRVGRLPTDFRELYFLLAH